MSPRVERYLDRAKECERMAAQAKKRQAAFLTRDAQQWRELARQAEYWERVRDMMPENLRRNQSTPLLPSIELGDELGLRGGSSENWVVSQFNCGRATLSSPRRVPGTGKVGASVPGDPRYILR